MPAKEIHPTIAKNARARGLTPEKYDQSLRAFVDGFSDYSAQPPSQSEVIYPKPKEKPPEDEFDIV